jgi:hypothetical protein
MYVCQVYRFCLNPVRRVNNKVCVSRVSILSEPSQESVQTKSLLLTHILYCLLSWLGSDKIDTLDTHTLLFTFLTGFRHNRYSWHTYFIVYFPDWVQTNSILLTHIHYCLLSWLGSDKIENKVCVSRVSILSEPSQESKQ